MEKNEENFMKEKSRNGIKWDKHFVKSKIWRVKSKDNTMSATCARYT